MNVVRYTFESPYANQVQIGRLDPSLKQEEDTQKMVSTLTSDTNQTQASAQNFQTAQVEEVEAAVTSDNHLDVYA